MKAMMPRLHLNCTGLAIFLGGTTQVAVYRAVLEQPGTLRRVLNRVNEEYGPIAYTTVATIANKLCDKGILERVKTDNPKTEYVYTARYTEAELIRCCANLVIDKLNEEYPAQLSVAYNTLILRKGAESR